MVPKFIKNLLVDVQKVKIYWIGTSFFTNIICMSSANITLLYVYTKHIVYIIYFMCTQIMFIFWTLPNHNNLEINAKPSTWVF